MIKVFVFVLAVQGVEFPDKRKKKYFTKSEIFSNKKINKTI